MPPILDSLAPPAPVVPATSSAAFVAAAASSPLPRDALAMQQLLASMGLQPGSYQPRVIAQLMEFQQRQTQ